MSYPFKARHPLAMSLRLALLVTWGITVWSQERSAQPRPIKLDDLYNLYELSHYWGGPASFSPDGQELAFVVLRPRRTGTPFNTLCLLGNDRADVYLVSRDGGDAVNITRGEPDRAGFWAPSWSPDGQRLALLSTRGGSLQVWIWERKSRLLRRVTEEGLDLPLPFASVRRPYVWLSPTDLLVSLLPKNAESYPYLCYSYTVEHTMAAWQQTWHGEGSSPSVLSSGVKPDPRSQPQGALVVYDTLTGKHRVIADETANDIVVSPDGRTIAFLRQQEVYQPEPDKTLPLYTGVLPGKFTLSVVSSDGASLLPLAASAVHVLPLSVRWSPDGKEIAFIALTEGREEPQLGRFLISNRKLSLVSINALDPDPDPRQAPEIVWTKKGWVVFASRRTEVTNTQIYARRDWWLIAEDGSVHSLTEAMPSVPVKLWRQEDRDAYIGLAAGALWRISTEGVPEKITVSGSPISAIVWPDGFYFPRGEAPNPYASYRQLAVAIQNSDQQEVYLVDLSSGHFTQVTKSPAGSRSEIETVSIATGAVLYGTEGTGGMRLFIAWRPGISPSRIFEANTFLQNTQLGSFKQIHYTSLNGEPLNAWILLPPFYKPEQKYPLIAWVYPTQVFAATPPPRLLEQPRLTMEIPAARGYAVLFPSIPINPEGKLDDFMLKLTSGVLPAVDKAVELGIADSERLFVMGHSWGGFATYGLVTQTNRFKAAVTGGQIVDLISSYGQFGHRRYFDDPHYQLAFGGAGIEAGMRIDLPPWKDLGRYLRNSPIFYVDRVQTPVMIIQGDMDSNSMEQAEEFFNGLYRQGKRAELVRYWGEGHVISSEANVRDMWDRIFAWFDEFSPKSTDKKPQE